jgi:hypothetical protein
MSLQNWRRGRGAKEKAMIISLCEAELSYAPVKQVPETVRPHQDTPIGVEEEEH